jgi:hypothetical protein
MVMVGQSKRLAEPMRLKRRERWLLAAIVCVLAAAAIGAGAYAYFGGDRYGASGAGCINVTVASTTGGATLHACGAGARQWCNREAGREDALALALQDQCRRAGYASRAAAAGG